jgi:hypothetical protein
VQDRQRTREIGKEDEARFQRGDEKRLAALVVDRDLRPKLRDAGLDLVCSDIDLPDTSVAGQCIRRRSFSITAGGAS